MRTSTGTAVPAFKPITITLESPEEARAMKLLCTTTAIKSVKSRRGLAVSRADVESLGCGVFRALKGEGVSYLTKNVR